MDTFLGGRLKGSAPKIAEGTSASASTKASSRIDHLLDHLDGARCCAQPNFLEGAGKKPSHQAMPMVRTKARLCVVWQRNEAVDLATVFNDKRSFLSNMHQPQAFT